MTRPTALAAAALAAGLAAAPAAAQDRPVLTVYTYDSFVTDWGPGPVVEDRFEAVCACDLNLVGAGDGAALLGRLRLEGADTDADVVLGLDTNLIAEAKETGLFAPHGRGAVETDVPGGWADETFLPYDWGWFAFVHDTTRLAEAPESFEALRAADVSLVIQDPRSSTPGLGLALWIHDLYGDAAPGVWADLAPKIVTVTKGWSEAYGLFLEGEADMVLSYTTSPAYHLIAEDDPTKAAAAFAEGHYMQVEVAGRIAGSDQADLAGDFLAFMLSEPFQSAIPTTNWMYPAVTPEGGLPEGFETLVTPETSRLLSPEAAREARPEAIADFREALSR